MTAVAPLPAGPTVLERTTRLMGGGKALGRHIANELDAHEVLANGVSAASLHHLIEGLVVLTWNTQLEHAVGISRRTYQRTKENPKRSLSAEQGGQAWRFAEVLALATDVLGTQELAERWLERPAIGLGNRIPLELLHTPTGAKAVETYLQQIKYGVYV